MFFTAEDHRLFLSHCFQHFDANSKGYRNQIVVAFKLTKSLSGHLDESELKCAVVAALGIQPSRVRCSIFFFPRASKPTVILYRIAHLIGNVFS